MGCSQSKIEDEEAVSRCKERRQFMKSAVAARNAFAAAHSSYAMSLKNTGAALSDFAEGETNNPKLPLSSLSSSGAGAVAGGSPLLPQPPPPIQTLPPPPPPIPDMPAPLQRAVTMPEFSVSKRKLLSESTIEEEDEGEEELEEGREEEEEEEGKLRRRSRHNKSSSVSNPPSMVENRGPPPPLPSGVSDYTYDYLFNVEDMPNGSLADVEEVRRQGEEVARQVLEEMPKRAVAGEAVDKSSGEAGKRVAEKPPLANNTQQGGGSGKIVKKGKQVVGNSGSGGEAKRRNLNLVQVFNELDDYFLKASGSAHEVSKILEATRLYFHSNFADNSGHIDHSARLMRVITWNRSFRGLPEADQYKDDLDSEENETLATLLDKLLAWEKKLYDEVKSGEIMKFEYQRKCALLHKQKNRGASPETLEKIKAAVSHLHTRYIVDLQAMDATVSEINRLRDEQLHPKLVALVNAMTAMWDTMQLCHDNQHKIALNLKAVDFSQSVNETTDHHHERTIQLWGVVQEWHTQFDKMVNYQKEYIKALNSWLKLNLVPIESNLKEKVSSPTRPQKPRIQNLLLSWQDHLEKLPVEHTKGAIYNFAAVLHTIVEQQEDELKMRAKMEESIKDLEKKERQYQKWLKEYTKKRMAADEFGEDGVPQDEAVVEREFAVENAKRKVEEDKENYRRQCVLVRQKTLTSLKIRLPELCQALAEFAHASSDMYSNLRSIS